MKRVLRLTLAGLLLIAFAVNSHAESIEGDWIAKIKSSRLWLRLEHKVNRSNYTSSRSYAFNDFKGLDPSLKDQDVADANFSLEHDAGVLHFEGAFRKGRGFGDFVFAPNDAFAVYLQRQGI